MAKGKACRECSYRKGTFRSFPLPLRGVPLLMTAIAAVKCIFPEGATSCEECTKRDTPCEQRRHGATSHFGPCDNWYLTPFSGCRSVCADRCVCCPAKRPTWAASGPETAPASTVPRPARSAPCLAEASRISTKDVHRPDASHLVIDSPPPSSPSSDGVASPSRGRYFDVVLN
ncbi:hypothetical protein L227DRAFT_126214 [Lentinus tigrinus ALCF2SS1-6]|uniref:Uncharacterized protein n=1 Tax=Lentinus tigrinus ALCF2SS1-6 TaxID=1328759 RepID=A0A5C2SS82_9APHY|nr:hypothetical protein L227DRAFT_126214 [Lentinus tigrinus ALCF2SS1-6]